MRCQSYLAVLACISFASSPAVAAESQFVVVGYLPEYRIDRVEAERLAVVTDVVYFGLLPTADGVLPESPVEESVLRKLHEIKRVADCRLLICVGGGGRSEGFPELAASDTARQKFIAGLLAFCRDNGFDGVDYDWEHPRGAAELADYAQLLIETKAAFREAQLLVTVAQAGWQDIGRPAYDAVDRVHLMSYDHAFPQATMEKATADVDRLKQWGCPAEKIAVGVPFYGRNKDRRARTYRQLVAAQRPAADLDEIDGFAFNGRETIAAKVEMATDQQLAGVMIWELGQDAADEELSLLKAIERRVWLKREPRE